MNIISYILISYKKIFNQFIELNIIFNKELIYNKYFYYIFLFKY